jgi:hypothetical protein
VPTIIQEYRPPAAPASSTTRPSRLEKKYTPQIGAKAAATLRRWYVEEIRGGGAS